MPGGRVRSDRKKDLGTQTRAKRILAESHHLSPEFVRAKISRQILSNEIYSRRVLAGVAPPSRATPRRKISLSIVPWLRASKQQILPPVRYLGVLSSDHQSITSPLRFAFEESVKDRN